MRQNSSVDIFALAWLFQCMDGIAACFRAARSLLKLEQEEVAKGINVSRRMIVRLERGTYSQIPHEISRLQSFYEQRGVVFLTRSKDGGEGIMWPTNGRPDLLARTEIRVARSLLGLSQRKLATTAEVGQGMVARFEKDLDRDVKVAAVDKLKSAILAAGVQFSYSPDAQYACVRMQPRP